MSNEFLTFTLADVQYAIPIAKVQEVLEFTKIVKIPCTASYIEGIINSRGQGISVVNLRKKFSIEDCKATKDTRIIVLEIKTENGIVIFGAIADSVQEVVELETERIEDTPEFGGGIAQKFVSGISRKNDDFIVILDVDNIFTEDETEILEKSVQDVKSDD